MKKRLPASRKTGFTIVEVIIVMAIAGLMFLLIFKAVPALLRNSRNNQRKQDVQTILQDVSRYELNHSGSIPPNASFLNTFQAKLSYYSSSDVTVTYYNSASGAVTLFSNPTDIATNDRVVIVNHEKCDSTSSGNATNAGAGYYDVVALFSVETGNGSAHQCQQL
jgi:prepilin-type N-terminal cleavage/methylation domain-containing protein